MLKLVGAELRFEDRELAPEATVVATLSVVLQDGLLVPTWLRIGTHQLILLEKAMAPHSSTLAWKIPWTEEPGGLQSMKLLRVGHD